MMFNTFIFLLIMLFSLFFYINLTMYFTHISLQDSVMASILLNY